MSDKLIPHPGILKTICISGLFLTALSFQTMAAPKMNVVFLLADDLRWNSLGCMGNSIVITPNIDIAPSIIAAAGAEIPATVQGADFSALYLTRKAPKWRQEFYYEHPVVNKVSFIPSSEALVTHSNKYIYWPDHQVEEYFDLKKDPFEEHNRIKEPKDQATIQALKKRLAELKQKAQ